MCGHSSLPVLAPVPETLGVGNSNQELLAQLQGLIAEEMFLLGQGLDDSLSGDERRRLAELSDLLDRAAEMLDQHRATAR